jgi:hypothetical protein
MVQEWTQPGGGLAPTPAMNPAETRTPARSPISCAARGDRDVVGAGQVRSLGVHLPAVLGVAGDARRRLPGGDRPATPAFPHPHLHLVFGDLRRRGGVMSNT